MSRNVVIATIVALLLIGVSYFLYVNYKQGQEAQMQIEQAGQQAKTDAEMKAKQAKDARDMEMKTEGMKEETVQLASINNSGQSGVANVGEENGKVTITLRLNGGVGDVSQPAHIHTGACPGVGAVKYPLTSIVNGQSKTTLNITMAELLKQLPLAINVHKSVEEVKTYTACGDIRNDAMGTSPTKGAMQTTPTTMMKPSAAMEKSITP